MQTLIKASEAAAIAQQGTEKVREDITKKLDERIRSCAKAGKIDMTFNLDVSGIITKNHESVIREILSTAGYMVLSIKYEDYNHGTACMATARFVLHITSRSTGSYQDR